MKRLVSLSIFLLAVVVSCTTVRPPRAIVPLVSSEARPVLVAGTQAGGGSPAGAGSAPLGGSWEAGVALFRQARPEDEAAALANETYLEICDPECELPGLFGDEQSSARPAGHVARVAGLNGHVPPEAVSYFEAANDFANRFNRAVFARYKRK